jgi:DNA-binding phage protein
MVPQAQIPRISSVVAEIQAVIRKQGLTSYALAKKTGLRISTMQRLIAGKGSPTIATLDAVAAVLGMKIKTERI